MAKLIRKLPEISQAMEAALSLLPKDSPGRARIFFEIVNETARAYDAGESNERKAHAKRNCGNCSSFYSSRCSLHDVSFTSLVTSKKLEEIIKCNDWKPREADNADA